MPSSAEVEAALGTAVDRVVAGVAQSRAAAPGKSPVILIDGRSGAGKTTLARRVSERLGATLLGLDSVYPGWSGLRAGSAAVLDGVLRARAEGRAGRWRGWDWAADAPGAEHTVPATGPLVVEGAGVLTTTSRGLSDVHVWVESPLASRRERALSRDGETYAPHWDMWAAQEAEHIRVHDPASLASVIVQVP